MAQTRQEQLLAVGVFMTANLRGESYARYALVTAPGTLPGGLYGAWLGWTYAPILAILAIFLPLYFPTGRLLSRRWRPVVWFGIGFLAFAVVGNALWPGPQPPLPGLEPAPNLVVFLPQAKPLFELFRNLAGLCLLPGSLGPSPRWWCDFGVLAGSNASSSSGSPMPRRSLLCPASPTSSLRASLDCCAR